MQSLGSTTPPARGLQASTAACTPKKGRRYWPGIVGLLCIVAVRGWRSPVFAGLVADRKSSASTDMTRPVGSLPNRCVLVPQARPRQTRTSARRLLALPKVQKPRTGGYTVATRTQKEKARY